MLRNLWTEVYQSKNILMLITAGIYMISLFSVLSGAVLLISALITLGFLFLIIKNYIPVKYVIIWCLLFYLGIVNTSFRIKETDELLNLAPVNAEITGTIVSIPQGQHEGKPKFFFDVDRIKFGSVQKDFKGEKVLVTVNSDEFNDLKLYNSCVLTGRLAAPFKAGNPSQFDYGNYLRNHNTYSVFYAKDCKLLEKELTFTQKVMQKINDYRENIISLHSKYLKTPNLEILGGIVFGDDAVSPPKEIKQSFIDSGLLHILAASGMNVAFIYSFFFILMSVFRIPFKIRVVIGMVMVAIYSLMTGLGASVIRATFMLLFVLIGKLIDRDAHSISLLSFVALLMLLYNPLFINDIGFQLSFIVTFGILIMAPAISRSKNKLVDLIAGTIAIPIIAQLWVMPVQIFYFNNISLYSVFANIMSVPILMVLSFGGFVSSLLSVITPIADFVCRVFDFILNPLISLLVNISDFWGALPHSALQTTHPSVFQLFLYYGILLCISGFLYEEIREKYFRPILVTGFVLLTVWLLSLIPLKNHNLEITAFDVGNADCFLIKTFENKYIMIDSGRSGYKGGKSQAEIIVMKYLKDRGIKNVETIIITHFDNDHCGGAVDLMKVLNVSKIYVNDLNHDSIAAKSIYKTAKDQNVRVIIVSNFQKVYDKDGLSLVNFNAYKGVNDNDNSIITLLRYKDFTMLFTGDAGIEGINSVINDIPRNLTVLKVPHHGANGGVNKDLVEFLNPRYSVISVGENKFGHPSIYTIKLLKNSKILRTDIDNSIRFSVNKKDFEVLTYDMKSRKYKKIPPKEGKSFSKM